MRLAGKVAIISGAAHGMGAAEAQLCAREGAKVVIADLLEDEGTRLAAEITAAGGEALFVRTDVTSEDDWRQVVQTTTTRFGKLDTLVNNAGLSSTSVADPMDTDGWRRIMDVNATGVFLGTKYRHSSVSHASARAHPSQPPPLRRASSVASACVSVSASSAHRV